MKTYSVRARRRDGGWDLDIKGIGVARCERLTGADRAVRNQLDVLGFADAATATLAYEYGADLDGEVRAVREGRASADAANRFAAERTRALATRLQSEGYRGAEIAMILDVSPQRVSQLVATFPPDAVELPGAPKAVDVRTKAEKAAAKERKKQKAKKKAKKPTI